MLEEIITLENELAAQIDSAKHDAAQKIQSARTAADDARIALEQKLRTLEHEHIASAEAKAQKEAAALISAAEVASSKPVDATVTMGVAQKILAPYLNHE